MGAAVVKGVYPLRIAESSVGVPVASVYRREIVTTRMHETPVGLSEGETSYRGRNAQNELTLR